MDANAMILFDRHQRDIAERLQNMRLIFYLTSVGQTMTFRVNIAKYGDKIKTNNNIFNDFLLNF